MSTNTSPDNLLKPQSTDQIAPLETVLSNMQDSVQTALTNRDKNMYVYYSTYSALSAVTGTTIGQHAIVNADPTLGNNGEYVWSGSAWIIRRMVGGRVIRSSKAATFGSGWNLLGGDATYWTNSQTPYGISAFNGAWTVPVAGMYQIEAGALLDATVNLLMIIKKNNSAASNAGAIMGAGFIGQGTFTAGSLSGTVPLAAGDAVRAAVLPSVGSAAWNTSIPDMSYFGIRLIEQAQ